MQPLLKAVVLAQDSGAAAWHIQCMQATNARSHHHASEENACWQSERHLYKVQNICCSEMLIYYYYNYIYVGWWQRICCAKILPFLAAWALETVSQEKGTWWLYTLCMWRQLHPIFCCSLNITDGLKTTTKGALRLSDPKLQRNLQIGSSSSNNTERNFLYNILAWEEVWAWKWGVLCLNLKIIASLLLLLTTMLLSR